MAQLDELRKHLRRGKVYRRTELARWSKSVDRHIEALVQDGTLQKLSHGMYYFPRETAFGKTPPEEEVLVRSFLKDDRFLLTSPNIYNSLGIGTTQLYNKRTVYNHKRHGEYNLGNRKFYFLIKPHFPKKITPEFLLVDLVNNLETLAEDHTEVLKNVFSKALMMERKKLEHSISEFGNAKAKKIFSTFMNAERS